MSKPPDPAPGPHAAERRRGRDRRHLDALPPKGLERRRGIEPRRPEVTELAVTPSQWADLVATPWADTEPAPLPPDSATGPKTGRA